MARRTLFLMLLCLCGASAPLEAQFRWTSDRPDGHAPLGVMGDHLHESGEFMLTYRYMNMRMDGTRMGEFEVTFEDVLDDFAITPLNMTTQMHMVSAMFAPADWLTLMGSVPFVLKNMEHLTQAFDFFETNTSGIGDAKVQGLIGLFDEGPYRAHLNAGLSIPTGSLDLMDVTPASAPGEARLAYPMQLGSGTFDLMPGLTVLAMNEVASVGAQGGAVFHMGENDQGYAQGDLFRLTGWAAYRFTEYVSGSARFEWQRWQDIVGVDETFAGAVRTDVIPTVRTDLSGGTRLDLPLGVNIFVPEGPLAGHRLAVEVILPISQDLNGPQLQSDWMVVVGWQKSFN